MIIRSQNKTIIININNASNIYMQGFEIWVNTFHGIVKIGTYSTEEKAIKVLDMIQNAYTQYGTLKDGLGSIHGAFNLPKCFQMPSDAEVEV